VVLQHVKLEMVFINMDLQFIINFKEELIKSAKLVPILLISENEKIKSLLLIEEIKLFSGNVFRSSIPSEIKTIKNALSLGYTYFPPSLSIELSFMINRFRAHK